MVGSPGPGSPIGRDHPPRPMSAMIRPTRSSSRMSMSSRAGGSRASDEDGRTSVKVAVRVRPPLRPTDPGYELIPQRFQKGMVHVTSPTSIAVDSPQGRKIFVFDRVFGPDVNQDGVWEYLEESVNAFLQGYNVSVLAYGQSGAGKSYTMGTAGPGGQDEHQMGVIPRAAVALFDRLSGGSMADKSSGIRAPVRYSTPIATLQRNNPDKGWTMKATYVEIYNEQLRDLLLPEGTRQEDRAPITIREDTKGRILLTGLRQVEITNVQDLLGVLSFGSSIRQTDATAINAKSSRSHAVFSLNLVQRKAKGFAGETGDKASKRLSMPVDMAPEGFVLVDSKMHFVDLAGSERLKNTHAQGERAKEGISINAGLASLGKVISQLSSRQSGAHVSYRDSKLTRLLQDSLGGNAITYMIACVTPAEFHLSETLNTIQYAQRARAIQSKPRIQQVADDADMKQLIDRLRAEIAFLREQLKNNRAESNDRAAKDAQGPRSGRSGEKEVELQNELLDLQENYNALSARHAKLISEITRATDTEDIPVTTEYVDTAVERLKRSNSFAEAVEQVVLEYEKTIQSLESSLTSTRSSLSNSESTLLEKESKLAYVETLNHQLQARIQKMMDRESSTESYLHDLEMKLSSHTSGEEKNATIIKELQKEIARVRENEAGCEDYISTLEERLAEAEQDMELMQREIARLEHVIDRQRSLGKLDNLLLERESMKDRENASINGVKAGEQTNGPLRPVSRTESEKSDSAQDKSLLHVRAPTPPSLSATPPIQESPAEEDYVPGKEDEYKYMPQSPAQSQFVADKFETVQQELFELKVEHEQTLQEFNQMSVNYESAVRKMSKLQDQLDELRHAKSNSIDSTTSRGTSPPESPIQRPTSFLADKYELKGLEEPSSSSVLLSSELSLAGESVEESPSLTQDSVKGESRSLSPAVEIVEDRENALKIHLETETERTMNRASISTPEDLLKKFEILLKEKEEAERIAEEETQKLQQQLNATRDELVTLKNITNAVGSTSGRNSGRNSPPTQFLRRKSSQSLAVVDRAQRAFANLRRMATEHLASQPEVLENFELNIDGAMRELTNRLDRISELEQEVNSLRKEMEAKTTMIAGLTRERTSIQTQPMDISVVSVMQRRIDETEAQLHKTKQSLADRERELAAARGALENLASDSPSNALSLLDELTRERRLTSDQASKILDLHNQVEHMRSDQLEALSSLQESKRSLERTIGELEEDLTHARESAMQQEMDLRHTYDRQVHDYQDRVEALQRTIINTREAMEAQLARVGELEKAQEDAQREIEGLLTSQANASASSDDEIRKQKEEMKKHQEVNDELEQKIAQNKELIESQQARLETMERDYLEAVKQLEVLKVEKAAALTALKETEERALAEATAAAAAHEELLAAVRAELAESQATATAHADSLAELQTAYDKLQSEKSVSNDGQGSTEELERKIAEQNKVIASHKDTIESHVIAIKELEEVQGKHEEELRKLREKERKHAKLVEDLEQELTFTFDQNQESAKKLASVTAEYDRAVQERDALIATSEQKSVESQKAMDSLNEEIIKLRAKISELEVELAAGPDGNRNRRSDSSSSNTRRSTNSTTSALPSPPPAIPLPPLPTSSSPPPGDRPSRRPSKDYVSTHFDDQEARIKTLEKQLQAEKALTATLEEALTDCEKTMKRLTTDRDSFQLKASQVQQELEKTRNESASSRYSMQAVEEERLARQKAEQAKAQLEERMQALNKKKTRSFACF
ncbi:hypothetical protein FN846DRAFT_166864 [Sphaerosporella brunnea]|uniref:Kinesin motor domain-containing protein n=1 Tax=Sphaerosporella brunnea TaxID=1250544 RepID=A0A5J5ER24_9PEZI|nr:hypothetical protein FN846DRAFT_166864 [Sphaerosporella brunnea]